jgi:translation initiation factor 1
MSEKKPPKDGGPPPHAPLTHSPFASLKQVREALPPSQPRVRVEDFPLTPPPGGPERVVLRLEERKGGPVTVVEGLGLPADALQGWLEALQRGLACRGGVEGALLVLGGDQRRAAPDLLLRRGVRRVVMG